LVPPVITILLAVFTRRIIVSLLAGVWLGSALVTRSVPFSFVKASEYIVSSLSEPGNAYIVLFLFAFGALAESFKVSRLAVIWCRKLGIADQSNAIAPAMCGVAMDVPLALVYALSPLLEHERVLVPGAVISGLVRPLPSAVTGPRLLKEAIVSVPVCKAPTV
jgi:hypothetical protein